jgi:hypothetical protein
MKICNDCPHFRVGCWEDDLNFCYRDKESIQKGSELMGMKHINIEGKRIYLLPSLMYPCTYYARVRNGQEGYTVIGIIRKKEEGWYLYAAQNHRKLAGPYLTMEEVEQNDLKECMRTK